MYENALNAHHENISNNHGPFSSKLVGQPRGREKSDHAAHLTYSKYDTCRSGCNGGKVEILQEDSHGDDRRHEGTVES